VAEFLVHIRVGWPADGDPRERKRLMDAESARRQELIDSGRLVRLWRDPGRWANWTLWDVDDATELNAELQSLPFFPWMTITVHALARHEADPASPTSA
jgi:muconolactone D-isomerase